MGSPSPIGPCHSTSHCRVTTSPQPRSHRPSFETASERLLGVGLSFHPTGALDAGIDGFLELRDPISGEVRAQFISAQLKAQADGSFPRETDERFAFPVRL